MQEIEREKKRLAKVERRKIEDEQKIVLDAVLEKQLDAGTVAVNTEYEQFIVRFFCVFVTGFAVRIPVSPCPLCTRANWRLGYVFYRRLSVT